MSRLEEVKQPKVEETLVKVSEYRYRRVQIKAEGLVKSVNKDGSLDIYNKSNGKLIRGIPSSIISPWTDEATIQYSPNGLTLFANYRNSGEWLPGKITEERKDGKFTINYEDGKIETSVEKTRIRYEFSLSTSDKTAKKKNSFWGSEVEWIDQSSNKWVVGRVISESDDGNFLHVKQSIDQDMEVVSRNDVKLLKSSESNSSEGNNNSAVNKNFKVDLDDKVEVNRNNKGKWHHGKVLMVRTDGTFDIEYNDDGKVESNVAIECIRPRSDSKVRPEESSNATSPKNNKSRSPKVGSSVNKSTPSSSSDASVLVTQENDINSRVVISSYWGPKVEVKCTNGSWKVGRVTGESQDDRFQITYDNNEDEGNGKELTELVSKEDIRLYKKKNTHASKLPSNTAVNDTNSSPNKGVNRNHNNPIKNQSDIKFMKSDRVDINYQGKGKWYPGRVVIVRTDGTYDILYDDGETEDHVSSQFITPYDSTTTNGKNNNKSRNGRNNNPDLKDSDVLSPLSEGQRVTVDYKGQGALYRGRVVAIRTNDKYDIELDDGEIVDKVSRRFIQTISSSSLSSQSPAVKKYWGPKVYCNYNGRGKWRVGRVTGETRDGRFQISYESDNDVKEVEIVTKDEIKPYESTSFAGREEEEYIEQQPFRQRDQRQLQSSSPSSNRAKDSNKPLQYDDDGGDQDNDRVYDETYTRGRGGNNNNNNSPSRRRANSRNSNDDFTTGRRNNRNRSRSGSPNRNRDRNGNNNSYDANEEESSSSSFIGVGDRVDVNYSDDKNQWMRGTVIVIRNTGAFDIEYDDGTIDVKIKERYLRKVMNNRKNGNNDIIVSGGRASSPKNRGQQRDSYNGDDHTNGNRIERINGGREQQDRDYTDHRVNNSDNYRHSAGSPNRLNNNNYNNNSTRDRSVSPPKRYVQDYNQEIIMSARGAAQGQGGSGLLSSPNNKSNNSRRTMSPSRRYKEAEDNVNIINTLSKIDL